MKTNFSGKILAAVILTGVALSASTVLAQETNVPAAQATATTTVTAPQLSYGVPQILQLSQAKVSDSTIITYIQNSGNSYGLDANQIIYLRQQGVSDAVLNTMLSQRGPQAQPTVSSAPAPQSQVSSDVAAQTPNAVVAPAVTYVQTVPTSSVYIIPDTQTYNYYANYYRPYYYYPYYPYPAVNFSFGWGGGWRGGYGGYHRGGWHR
ncbi:MAG TPA: hypothetical protein VHG89_00865 [Verrucomicrobiae bacterium]|nr:hypothetical protein [Verrucomicrobiae bacterium]